MTRKRLAITHSVSFETLPTRAKSRHDPNVPPLPPHIKLEQAKKFESTLLKGDPDQAGVIVQTAKQVLSTVLPGKK